MTIFQAIILGIVQGLTEFIPVSSTAHLVFAARLINLYGGVDKTLQAEQTTATIAVIQLGTLLAVLIYFARDIVNILRAFIADHTAWLSGRVEPGRPKLSKDAWLGWLVILDWVSDVEQSSVFDANRRRPTLLDWIDAAVLPLSLALQATYALRAAVPIAATYWAEVVPLLLFTWRRPLGATRDASVAALLMLAVAALYAMHPRSPTVEVLGMLTVGLVALALHAARPSMSWVAGSVVLIANAARIANLALVSHQPYTLPPFGTEASLAALLVAIALVTVSQVRGRLRAAMEAVRGGRDAELGRMIVSVAPWAWAFWWGFLELTMAFSRSTSTLLLVVYFAVCAVFGVAFGHRRQSGGVRKTGLALALLSAGTAVYGATSFFVVGMRVLAYLVISAFLLGIAYWYRRPGSLERPPTGATATP